MSSYIPADLRRKSSDRVSHTGVVFVGGFKNDMPRQNIEEVLKHMLTNSKAKNDENFLAPVKLGNSGRIQFADNDSIWDFLKSCRLMKDKCRRQYGADFLLTWAAKEKSFGRKQCDRITREVARLLKTCLDQVPEDDFIVEYNRKNIFVLGMAVTGSPIRPPICIAETAFGSNTWAVQNLSAWGKSESEGSRRQTKVLGRRASRTRRRSSRNWRLEVPHHKDWSLPKNFRFWGWNARVPMQIRKSAPAIWKLKASVT